jgi:hypothetical protein
MQLSRSMCRVCLLVVLGAAASTGCGSSTSGPAPAATSTGTATPTATASRTFTATATPSSTATATASATATRTATALSTATATNTPTTTPPPSVRIDKPVDNQLLLAGNVDVVLQVTGEPLIVTLDGQNVTSKLTIANGEARGTLEGVAAGQHGLVAQVGTQEEGDRAAVGFEAVELTNPDECEVLNNAECLLPYPSSRFLAPANTPTGFSLMLPEAGMPKQFGKALLPAPYSAVDGFSPTVQILMTFPGGVDPALSNAARLLPETRTYDARSLDADSPTVLLDVTADPPVRVLHFIEPDARSTDANRQVLFLRPGRSLTPGHRYIVAVRNLIHADGTPVVAEPAFAALRDNRPTDIAAIEARRAQFDDIFARLAAAGVAREDLVLAFDFIVQSDAGLTGQMLSMRDQSFAWLAQQGAGAHTFSIEKTIENDCSMAGTVVWREVQGTYQVPLFLTSDPVADPMTPGFLNTDDAGVPVQNGFTNPPFTIAIPCTVLADGGTAKQPVILGHGLFGTGRDFVESIAQGGFDYIAGATDWSGLSGPDISGDLPSTFLGRVILHLNDFAALPDRLRQGQLNTLLLAKMMKTGVFNADPTFQTPGGAGVFAGPTAQEYYVGGSLGGIMGLMFAGLSPDVVNAATIVPAINFSILLQRATPFVTFQGALDLTGVGDAMEQALLLGIIHELWVRGESAGYATHITSDPLPGTNAKNILMASAFLDQEVSNQGTEIAARTLGLPSLVGSLQTGLVGIPDMPGPLPSALVMYDTGSFDLDNPAHAPFIPPLANLQPQANHCDPHGLESRIPASIEQLRAFLQPGGQVQNYCNGRCDAGEPSELPDGKSMPCDPLAQ